MIRVADLFCGAGGTSTGLARAAEGLGVEVDLIAVNHWQLAVATHERNHPWARHVCADLASVEADPNKLVPGGKLDILVASPECTHFSVARGARPCSDQSRASAWHVLHWCERLDIREVLVENVKEFLSWGPLGPDDKPIKARKGDTFKAWVAALESLGYVVEWRVLNAADYGAATTRRRLFVRASKSGKIEWPPHTHGEGCKRPWRGAREIIDWTTPGVSIRRRKRPLAPRTMDRIEAGLRKFGGEAFIAVLRGTSDSQRGSWASSINEPLKTISAGGVHAALCEPFIVPMEHSGRGALRGVQEPLPTITTAKGGAFGLCTPFVLGQQSGAVPRAVSEPLPTIATAGAISLVAPCLTRNASLDVRFRMLQPHELAAAMGFADYKFEGNKTQQVKQIGNAVVVEQAQALSGVMLRQVLKERRTA